MSAVLAGMSIVWAIILLGHLLGRTRVLGEAAPEVLNRLVYWVATPALLFVTLAETDVVALVSAPLAVAALSATGVALLFAVVSRFLVRDSPGATIVGSMCSSVANAGHLGIPLAAYVLGSATHVVPVLLFQLGFFTPMFFVLTELVSRGGGVTPRRVVGVVLSNPMVLAAALGMALGASGAAVPALLMEPVRVVAGAAVPAVLISFGISLAGTSVRGLSLRGGGKVGVGVVLATALKLLAQPVLAFLLGRFAFGLEGHALFAVVTMAGLPTAQNAHVVAFRTGTATGLARGAVLATTLLAIPSLAVIGAWLA